MTRNTTQLRQRDRANCESGGGATRAVSRRRLLLGTAGLVVLSGCSIGGGESGNIQIANRTDTELLLTIRIHSGGGLFSDPELVYEDTFRQFPTTHDRAAITDVVRPGTYRVQVAVTTPTDETVSAERSEWQVSGEPSAALIVAIESGPEIEFLTQ